MLFRRESCQITRFWGQIWKNIYRLSEEINVNIIIIIIIIIIDMLYTLNYYSPLLPAMTAHLPEWKSSYNYTIHNYTSEKTKQNRLETFVILFSTFNQTSVRLLLYVEDCTWQILALFLYMVVILLE